MKNSINLRYILHVLFKYKYHSLAMLLATLATIVIATFFVAPIYEASSTLLIKFGRQYEYLPGVGTGRGSAGYYNREGIINTEIQILLSRDLLEKTCKAIGSGKLYPELLKNKSLSEDAVLEAAVDLFSEDLSVVGSNKSNILHISFEHVDPAITVKAVNLLVTLFTVKHVQTFSDPQVNQFLEEKVTFYQKRLKQSSDQLQSFKHETKTFDFKTQIKLLLEERANLSALYRKSKSQLAKYRKKLQSMELQHGLMSESIPLFTETSEKSIINNIKSQLLDLQLTEKELLLKYDTSNPKVKNLRERINLVKQYVKEQETSQQANVRVGKSEVYQDIQRGIILTKAEMQSQEAESAVLGSQLQTLDKTLSNLSQGEEELNRITREFRIDKKNYNIYQSKLEESRISTEMDRQKMTNIKVVEPALLPFKPIKPDKKLNLTIGAILGVFFAVVIAFFYEYINQGLYTAESVKRRLGLSLLTTLFYREKITSVVTDSGVKGSAELASVETTLDTVGKTGADGQMIGLFHTMISQIQNKEKKVIQFIGAGKGEGTSTISRNFARVTASVFDRSILLISSDLMLPVEGEVVGGETVTIDELINSEQPVENCFRKSCDEGVWLCPASLFDKSLSALFSSKRNDPFLEKLKDQFDMIIIDSQPLSVSQDGLAVAREVDGIILVIESEKTRWPVANDLRDRLSKVNGTILGIILNKQKTYIPSCVYRLL